MRRERLGEKRADEAAQPTRTCETTDPTRALLSTRHARDGDQVDLARVELRSDEGLVVAPA